MKTKLVLALLLSFTLIAVVVTTVYGAAASFYSTSTGGIYIGGGNPGSNPGSGWLKFAEDADYEGADGRIVFGDTTGQYEQRIAGFTAPNYDDQEIIVISSPRVHLYSGTSGCMLMMDHEGDVVIKLGQ